MKPSIKRLRDTLFATNDGEIGCDAINALAKQATKGDDDAKAALADYTLKGKLEHLRSFACSSLTYVAGVADHELATVFERGLSDRTIRYWSILGYINQLGRTAYNELTKIACDHSLSVEDRAHAVKCLASHSKQPFDRQLPADPGQWKGDDIRIKEIKAWLKSGYPKGKGYPLPTRHPALDNPKTSLEQLVSRLDKLLARQRKRHQDAASPTNWLAVANDGDLKSVRKRWKFPAVYLNFLTRFSPIKVVLESKRFWNGGLELYGAGELIAAQDGYAFNPVKKKLIRGWPNDYVVIANHGGDPFVLDLSSSDGKDAPVLTAEHGAGKWDFELVSESFAEFLKSLAK
jgi:hypothetical protein